MDMIVFFLFLVVLFVLLAPKPPTSTESRPGCPPHKWKTVEIKDDAGQTVLHKLVCERCGPPQYTARKDESN